MNLSLKEDLGERRSYLDPHGGGGGPVKSGLCRAAIVDIARDRWNRIWVLDCWADRVGTEEMVNKLIEHYCRWKGRFGIDNTGQQKLFVDTVRTILRLRGLSYIPIEGIQCNTRTAKIQRIRAVVQPVIAERRLLVRKGLLELRAEMASFPTGQTMDLVDALAGAISMLPTAPATAEENSSGEQDYADFLREQGLTDEAVHDRLLEEFGETTLRE